MGSIPWADWIYNLPYRREEVNSLHSQVVTAQEQILTDSDNARATVDQYKQMVATNLLLMMTVTEVHLSNEDYMKYRKGVDAMEEPVNGSLPANIISFIAEFGAGNYVFKAIFRVKDALVENIPKAVRAGIARITPEIVPPETTLPDAGGRSGVSAPDNAGRAIDPTSANGTIELPPDESGPRIGQETSTLTEDNIGLDAETQTAVEAMGKASLAEWAGIGIGIGAAIGVDAIFSAISGATEKSQLDKQIDQLTKATGKMKCATTALTKNIADAKAQIVVEQKRLRDFVNGMEKIFDSQPEYPVPTRIGYDKYADWVAYGKSTVNHYLIFSDMKAKKHNFMLRRPNATNQEFVDWYILGASIQITQEKLDAYAKLLDEVSKRVYSSDVTAAN
jgi:hypothetical protein